MMSERDTHDAAAAPAMADYTRCRRHEIIDYADDMRYQMPFVYL